MAQIVEVRDLHRVVGPCIVYRIDPDAIRYLILKRHPNLKVYPNLWTVPGGGMDRDDYLSLPKTSPDGWENPIEISVRREVMQEGNVEVGEITYLNNFTFIRGDDIAVFGLRFYAPYVSGEARFDPEDATEVKWITAAETPNYEFLGNIPAEIDRVEALLKAA